MNAKRLLSITLAAPALFAVVYCGSSDSTPPTVPTPAPTTGPTAPPVLGPLHCDPTPPPLYGFRMKVHQNSGNRKTIDSTPQVINVDGYCQATGQDGNFCFTRLEGNPQRADCDAMAVGVAPDTGRYGPRWLFDGEACGDIPAGGSGCNNHPDNQFLVIAKGSGRVAACATQDVPIAAGGSRCGECRISPNNGRCQ
jgi:hypothetical protein